jgi:hypothetical protein
VFVLTSLLLAVAIAGDAPSPLPSNPFTLEPLPRASALPVIGSTRTKPVCTALRRAVKPALESAMRNDATYGAIRKNVFDYVVRDDEQARDLHLVQMDRKVDELVKSTDALDAALRDPSLRPAAQTVRPADGKTLHGLRSTLEAVLAAQRVQLDVMSGFVETERARRFGKLDESAQGMQNSVSPAGLSNTLSAPAVTGFLNDEKDVFAALKHPTVNGLADGSKLDRDFADIAAFTAKREAAATQAVVEAVSGCRP